MVFWNVRACKRQISNHVTENLVSIFRVEEIAKEDTSIQHSANSLLFGLAYFSTLVLEATHFQKCELTINELHGAIPGN
jgi:hypothetical protein